MIELSNSNIEVFIVQDGRRPMLARARAAMSPIGPLPVRAHGAACPQLAKSDGQEPRPICWPTHRNLLTAIDASSQGASKVRPVGLRDFGDGRVPPGSLAKGQFLVASGGDGKTTACTIR